MSGHATWNVEELWSHAESVGTIAQNVSGAAKVGRPMSGSAYGIIGQLFAGQVIATDRGVSASVGKLAQDVRDHQMSLRASMRAYQEVEREHTAAFRTMHQRRKEPPSVSSGPTPTRSTSGGPSPTGAGGGAGPGGGCGGTRSGEEKRDGEGSSGSAKPAMVERDGTGIRAYLEKLGGQLGTLDGRLDELEDEQDKLDDEHRRLERELGKDDLAPGEREKWERQLEGVEREQEKLARRHDELAGEYDTLQDRYDRLDDQERPTDSDRSGTRQQPVRADCVDRRPPSLVEQALLGADRRAT